MENNTAKKSGFKGFLIRKKIVFSAKTYFIEAMSAMANGLFASLLIGTIISTLGQRLGIQLLIDIGNFAKGVAGPAMAVSTDCTTVPSACSTMVGQASAAMSAMSDLSFRCMGNPPA